MERQRIFSLRFGFDSRAFIKGQITRRKHEMNAQAGGNLTSHMAIPCSRHPIVDLREQPNVA
jgi:hypothetical protein